MIFIDTNIPMYLIGADQALQLRARALVEDAVALGEVLCTDAEVLQEILHRYVAIRRPEFIDPAFETLLGVVDVVYPIEREDVERDGGCCGPRVGCRPATRCTSPSCSAVMSTRR